MDIPKQNTGLLIRPQDSLPIGATVEYEVRVPSGDWRPYLTTEEHQYSDNTDLMACVTFSGTNSLEIQTKQQTGAEVNYSDRYTAKNSGTTKKGNYLQYVVDSMKEGVVLEKDYPAPPNFTWDSYYTEIPKEVRDKRLKLDIKEQWIATDKGTLLYHLKHAPIQITIPEPYPNHAVCLVAIEGDTAYYFDSYPSYLKTIPLNKISSALKIVLTIKKNNMFLANDKGTVFLITGNQDKRKIGIADLNSLGLFGDEPQIPMDTMGIPEYNTIVNGKTITHK
jgi:hypothetical protein